MEGKQEKGKTLSLRGEAEISILPMGLNSERWFRWVEEGSETPFLRPRRQVLRGFLREGNGEKRLIAHIITPPPLPWRVQGAVPCSGSQPS